MADARFNALDFRRWFTLCLFSLASALPASPAWAQAASVDFCAVDSVFNVTQTTDGQGQFYRYTVGSGTPDVLLPELTLDVAPNLNALMVDPVNNRLLFVSYSSGQSTLYAYDPDNGGWYVAAGPITTPDFPRAGMTQAGVGYLVAGNGNNPSVWRVEPSGAFDYTLTSYGTLTYDIAPTSTSSGDIAFDAGGIGWLTAGVDIYQLDFSTSTVQATRQQRPLLNGTESSVQWAGVAYGNDGLLYLATNSSPSGYYRVDLSAGTLSEVTTTAANQARDLASCSFPAVSTPAELQVEKTLAQVNGSAYVAGAAVSAGDTLTYQITVTHTGGTLAATLFAGEVDETLPANTTVVTTGNDFTCTGSNCSNTNAVNIPTGGSATLNFVVQVDTPFPTGATASIVNTVAVDGVDCAAAGNDCGETTAVGLPALSLDKTSSSTSYTAVGDTLSYSYLVTNSGNTTITDPITVSDDKIVSPAVVTCPALPSGGLLPDQSITCTATYTVTQADLDAGSVTNVATATDGATTTPSDTVTVTATANPSWTVVKSSTDTTFSAVGDVLDYSYLVSNTGNVSISAIAIADDRTSDESCPATTLAAGASMTCTATYTVTQADLDAGSVTNNVTMTGTPSGGSLSPAVDDLTVTATANPSWTVVKSSTDTTFSAVGDVLDYSYLVTNTGNVSISAIAIADDRTSDESCPATTLAAGASMTCTATYTVTQADLDASSVTNNVTMTGTPSGGNLSPAVDDLTINATAAPGLSLVKTAGTPSGNTAGSTIGYTFTVTNTGNVAFSGIVINDALLDAPAVCDVTTLPPNGIATCTGTHTITQAEADAGTVDNSATATGTPPSGTAVTSNSSTTSTPLLAITVSKTSNPASGTTVSTGDTLTYTLTLVVANAATTSAEVLTDTLGAGLTIGTLPAGCTSSGQVVTCTLAAGSAIGTYTFVYTATVDADAATSVSNSVVPSSATCLTCTTTHPIASRVTVNKTADPASGETVEANDTITYTVTVTVANSATSAAVSLADTLSGGQTLLSASIQVPAGGACNAVADGLECTLAAGTTPGSYAFSYQAQVDAGATGTLGNTVVVSGGGGEELECQTCSTEHRVAEPVIDVTKSATPGSGTALQVGDTLQYTLTVSVSEAATTADLILEDTPSAGLTLGALPAGCSLSGDGLRCVLSSGSAPGTYTFTYSATVDADAGATVSNAVLASGGGGNSLSCSACSIEHTVLSDYQLRIVKSAGVSEAQIGDLVRYTLSVENVGDGDLVNGSLVDTPPAGFSYVEGSLTVEDGDNLATVSGQSPIRFDGVDIAAGGTATLTYLMRVGAGVRQGTQTNQVQGLSSGGDSISNVATAEITVVADELIDEALLLGTVFDDRDGDGWQDSAALSGVRVQGGFAPDAYVPNSTTIDRGQGPQPLADASAPLLHGIVVGAIAGRQSVADPVQAHQVVIRQRVKEAAFTDDFVLTNKQGVTVRMNAAGDTSVEKRGEAAKGLNAAAPTVQRRLAQDQGGYVVDYVIGNQGIDERGLPGVRIASVEGLLIETDPFGRYHLEGVAGGEWERGRNFILKVDPSTLPTGAEFTTDNPLLRRITPGLPVRFDFGVRLPVEQVQGGMRQVELELGEVIFVPGSAQVRAQYLPVIERMAAKVEEYGGGEVVITANGDPQGLAFDRAMAVKDALLAKLIPATAKALTISARTEPDDPASLLVGVAEGGPRLGTVLFDTDQATVKPQYLPILDKVAAYLDAQGGGTITIVGHADPRGSDAYNAALGLRRARAVYERIAARLSPEVRAKVRVESSNDPAAPAGNGK